MYPYPNNPTVFQDGTKVNNTENDQMNSLTLFMLSIGYTHVITKSHGGIAHISAFVNPSSKTAKRIKFNTAVKLHNESSVIYTDGTANKVVHKVKNQYSRKTGIVFLSQKVNYV